MEREEQRETGKKNELEMGSRLERVASNGDVLGGVWVGVCDDVWVYGRVFGFVSVAGVCVYV